MKLTYKNNKFIAESTYDERSIPKQARFRWDPTARHWWTDDPDWALSLLEYADETAKARLDALQAERQKAVEASKAVDATIDVPHPEGLEYMPFQKAGIAFALGRKNVLFGDEMGLGKTIQAIGVINADDSIKKVLVICPASLKLNWQRELEAWLTRKLSIEIVRDRFPDADITIINYDILKKFKSELDKRKFDLLIIDESHYCKNPKAQRTQCVFGKREKRNGIWSWKVKPIDAERIFCLTGTPIPNCPVEGWPIFHALKPDTFKSFWAYTGEFCNRHHNGYGWDFTGANNLDRLQGLVRQFMVRRLKKDVLTELPAKRRQVIELPANGCQRVIDNEKRAWQAHRETVEALRAQVELSKASEDEDAYRQAVERLREASRIAFTEISKLRHETAVAKIPYMIAHLRDALEEGKVVFFAHHKDVIAAVYDEFKDVAVKLTGDTSMQDRQAAVDAFQNDPNVRLFIGSIMAAGVGLTLTESSHVIFGELDWVPGNVTQAEDRTHRIGQKNAVLIQHLVLEGSLDAHMAKTLVRKQAVIDATLDDEKITLSREPLMPEMTPEKSLSTSQKAIEVEAEEITASETALIHEALRALANRCNFARTYDAQGFNKIDARIGHSLADSMTLTKRQAALGRRLLKKYRKQLDKYGIDISCLS